jgi:uncharacterized protein with HEPN domain
MSRSDDEVRLRHMLDATREALAFAKKRHREDLDADRMLALALMKCIEILGEAGARISPDAQARHSNIPWAEIVGMRNHLVHGYFDIDLDRLWATVMHDLPQLASSLERILSRPTR